MENTTLELWLKLLSAGVVSSFVAGIFSLVVAIKNNRRLLELEKSKQKFTLNQERFKGLREAYAELLNLLPEEKRLGHVIMNLPSKRDFQEDGLAKAYEIAEENMKILYTHFQRNCFLFSEDEQKKVADAVEELDEITKTIINESTALHIYDTEKNGEDSLSLDLIHESILERILKVTEFEEMYYNLFTDNLSKIAQMDNKRK